MILYGQKSLDCQEWGHAFWTSLFLFRGKEAQAWGSLGELVQVLRS